MKEVIEMQEWIYIYRALENTNVLGKEIGPFTKLMQKLDAQICKMQEEAKPKPNGISPEIFDKKKVEAKPVGK